MHAVPPITTIVFLSIVLVLIVQAYRWQRALGVSNWFVAGLACWLAFTAILALTGFFQDFTSFPPRVALAVMPPFLAVVFIAWRTPTSLFAGPMRLFVSFQVFRILMEMVLYALYYAAVLPEQMTWDGRNFDVLVGITAPIVSLICLRSGKEMRGVMIGWNIVSICLLVNIMIVGLLSAPTPFRVFTEGPANSVVALWPWIWLPSFVVPMALAGHVLSLRQLFHRPSSRA